MQNNVANSNNQSPIGSLGIIGRSEIEKVLVEWNAAKRSLPGSGSINELFRKQVERAPDQIALVNERQVVSYRELNRRANQLGHYLRSLGVGPEVVVGTYLNQPIEVVVVLMGVLKAGGAYLALDPEGPVESLSYILNDSGVRIVVAERELKERLPTYSGEIVRLDLEWEKIREHSESEPESEALPELLAYVAYTSGWSGSPEGVAVEHRGIVNFINWQSHAFRLSPQSRISSLFSHNSDGAACETFMALLNGSTLVISTLGDLESYRLPEFINQHRITVAFFRPPILQQIDPEQIDHPEEMTVVSVGEQFPVELAAEWSKLCGFINVYRPVGYTAYSHLWEVSEGKFDKLGRAPIGRPIDNTKSYILDDKLRSAPIGVAGAIYLAGAGIARGYLNQPQSTAVNFIPNHFFPDEISVNHGFISVESVREANNRFKVSKGLTKADQYREKNNSIENITPARILESVKGLDPDLIESTNQFIEKYGGDEFAYRGFGRYFREGTENSYASCGINGEILKMLFQYQSFAGLRGIDFCFGNGEVLEELSELGAQVLGLDLSPFLVQSARNKNLNVRMAKVDVPPEVFAKDTGIEEGSQDFVISTLTLDRLDNPRNFLENLFMSLKAGGRFAIQTLLPILPIDDGNVENPITYTSTQHRITPGQNVEQDKQSLLRLIYILGACDVNICQLPYVVASRDGFQEYKIWSFYGSKISMQGLERRNVYHQRLYKTGEFGRYLPDGSIHLLGRMDHKGKVHEFRIELDEIEVT